MPQPPEITAIALSGTAHWAAADREITSAIEDALTGKRNRVKAAIRSATRRLEERASQWAAKQLATAYVLGGQASAVLLAPKVRSGELAIEAPAELIAEHLSETKAVTEAMRLVRLPKKLPVMTPAEVRALKPGELAKLLRSPVGMVRYADGSMRTLADHGDMLTRTRAATAFNRGTLDLSAAFGVTHVEVADGLSCQWVTHDSGGTAHGRIVTLAEAAEHTLAHPRCQRSFRPRPDIRGGATRALLPPQASPDGPAGTRRIEARGRRERSTGRARRLPRTARRARAHR